MGAFTLLGFDDGSWAYYVEGHSGGQLVIGPTRFESMHYAPEWSMP
jgi:hypothetical protein